MTLPDGFRVRLAGGVIRAGHGRLLVGGSPLTAVRLSERGRDLLVGDDLVVGVPDSAHLAERLLATNLAVPVLDATAACEPGDVTVVLPVRDRTVALDRALAALRPLHCLVVDDASLEPRDLAAVATRHGADLLRLTRNVGPASARNAGLARVTTPYVAFVDCDVEASAAALLRLAGHFSDPSVALVGPLVTGISRSTTPRWFERYDEVASSLSLGHTPGGVRPGAAVAWLPSACLVGRVAALGGGFEDGLRVGEDVDLVWRLVAAGSRVRYDPTVEVRHDARATFGGWLARPAVYGSGGARLAARHGDALAPAVLTPTYAVAAAALLLRRRWSIPVAAVAVLAGTRSVRATLPAVDGRDLVAARLAGRGLGWAVRQESALLVRHWWPAAAVAAYLSRHVRRALVSAAVADTAVGLLEVRRSVTAHARPGLVTLVAGRRLTDLAYGAGLWWGALQRGSVRVLVPRRPGRAGRDVSRS